MASSWSRAIQAHVECWRSSIPRSSSLHAPERSTFVNVPRPCVRLGTKAMNLYSSSNSSGIPTRSLILALKGPSGGAPALRGDARADLRATRNPRSHAHLPSVFLGLFDRVQQDVPRPCADRLMRLDPSESRIAISSVTETGDEQPLQGILLTIVNVTLPLSQALQMPSPFDERCHDSTEESPAFEHRYADRALGRRDPSSSGRGSADASKRRRSIRFLNRCRAASG